MAAMVGPSVRSHLEMERGIACDVREDILLELTKGGWVD